MGMSLARWLSTRLCMHETWVCITGTTKEEEKEEKAFKTRHIIQSDPKLSMVFQCLCFVKICIQGHDLPQAKHTAVFNRGVLNQCAVQTALSSWFHFPADKSRIITCYQESQQQEFSLTQGTLCYMTGEHKVTGKTQLSEEKRRCWYLPCKAVQTFAGIRLGIYIIYYEIFTSN